MGSMGKENVPLEVRIERKKATFVGMYTYEVQAACSQHAVHFVEYVTPVVGEHVSFVS